jgi:cell wall-associated NlpC family hydrolase
MSNHISVVYKNGFRVISLLFIFIVASGFVNTESIDKSERKRRKKIVKTAEQYLGTKYRAGGKTPKGFDCSGFSYFVLKENNVKIGASSREQANQGKHKKIKQLEAGDLVFFGSKKHINHVGIVTKKSKNELWMIHASSSRGIVEEEIYQSSYWKKRLQFGRSFL